MRLIDGAHLINGRQKEEHLLDVIQHGQARERVKTVHYTEKNDRSDSRESDRLIFAVKTVSEHLP